MAQLVNDRLQFIEQIPAGSTDVVLRTLDKHDLPVGTEVSAVYEQVDGAGDIVNIFVETAPRDTLDSKAISGITRASQVATATTVLPHILTNGDVVRIQGALQGEYNGDFVVTVTGGSTFTYTVVGSPTTPATGTISFVGAHWTTISASDPATNIKPQGRKSVKFVMDTNRPFSRVKGQASSTGARVRIILHRLDNGHQITF